MVVRFLRGEEMMKEWRKEGLTLVELLIVVAVIAALAALLFLSSVS
jgi:prepilin-type N-terminal cleavage/methylation domain